ncbi:MAG: hypothetical protein JKY56_25195 [Kofleriaceae bacterium]|nr:hypothetical protein [Kofleriaceae bacterium]
MIVFNEKEALLLENHRINHDPQGRNADNLVKLITLLDLKRVPKQIECFDIAHLQGTETVASMVTVIDGKPDKSRYRKFKVKTVSNDDFGAMFEVLTRRFRRALKVPGLAPSSSL